MTEKGFINGPYLEKPNMGHKKGRKRADPQHFFYINPRIAHALHHVDEIDIDNVPMYSVIIWMDGRKTIDIFMGDYACMRRVSAHNNIQGMVEYMDMYKGRILTQLYGYHYMSLMDIPLDSDGTLTFYSRAAMDNIFEKLGTPVTTVLEAGSVACCSLAKLYTTCSMLAPMALRMCASRFALGASSSDWPISQY